MGALSRKLLHSVLHVDAVGRFVPVHPSYFRRPGLDSHQPGFPTGFAAEFPANPDGAGWYRCAYSYDAESILFHQRICAVWHTSLPAHLSLPVIADGIRGRSASRSIDAHPDRRFGPYDCLWCMARKILWAKRLGVRVSAPT